MSFCVESGPLAPGSFFVLISKWRLGRSSSIQIYIKELIEHFFRAFWVQEACVCLFSEPYLSKNGALYESTE